MGSALSSIVQRKHSRSSLWCQFMRLVVEKKSESGILRAKEFHPFCPFHRRRLNFTWKWPCDKHGMSHMNVIVGGSSVCLSFQQKRRKKMKEKLLPSRLHIINGFVKRDTLVSGFVMQATALQGGICDAITSHMSECKRSNCGLVKGVKVLEFLRSFKSSFTVRNKLAFKSIF